MKQSTRWTFLGLLMCFSALVSAQTLPGDSIVFGPMFSPVYNDSVRVWVLTKDATGSGKTLSLELSAASSSTPLTGTVHNSDTRLGYFLRSYVFGGLVDGETYTAVLKENGTATSRTSSVKNQTSGYNDFSFLAGGCGRIYDTTRCIDIPEATGGGHINGTTDIFDQMATEDSDMMVWLGDAVYLLGLQHAMGQCPNAIDDWANKDQAFARYIFYRQFHDKLTQAMPQISITDNHDTGPNEFDKTMPSLGDMKEIFMDWWPNAHYNSTSEGQGLFSSYTYNDVEFFITDNRSYRTNTAQHFGPEQQAWLKQALLNSTATFKIIISGTPVFNPWGGRNYVVSPQGIELRQFIQDNNINGVLAYDADIHREEFYGNYHGKYPLYDIMSGNLASDIGNNPSFNINYNDDKILGGVKQTYIKTSVEGDATDRRIRIQYKDEFGVPYFETIIHSDMLVSQQDSVQKLHLTFANNTADSSADNRTLTQAGISFGNDREGNTNEAAVFGATSSLSTVHTTNLNMHNRAFSLTYWVNPASFGSNGSVVLSKGDATSGFSIGFDKEGYPEYTDHASGNTYTSSRKLLTNKWAHLGWVYDNVKRQLKLYFNGQQIEFWSNVLAPAASPADLTIGNNHLNQKLEGSLDELSLYGKLISVESIQQASGLANGNGSALQLGGSQNMHIPGSVINPIFADDFTIEFWAKLLTDPCTNCKVLASNGRVNGNSTGISFEFSDQNKLNVSLGVNGGGWNVISNPGNSWNIGEWNHVALSFVEGDSMKMYINGQLTGANPVGAYITNSWGLGLGDSPAYGSEVNAEIEDLRLWNSALSQDSIQQSMHHALEGTESNLQLYYDFAAYSDTSILSKGAITHELLFNGGQLTSSSAPLANIDSLYQTTVSGNWSIRNQQNTGLTLVDPITDYITNLVVGKSDVQGFDTLNGTQNKFYYKGGWQLASKNLPFANLRFNLVEALPHHDSITNIAGTYFLVHEDSTNSFSTVNTGSFDGQNVTFFNTYLEGGVYYLAWDADTSGSIGRGGALSLTSGHDVSIPYGDVDSVLTGAFTMETWFRLTQQPGNNDKLISSHGRVNNNTTGLAMEFPSNNSLNVVFGTNTGSWNSANSNATFNVGEWNHLALTVEPNDSFKIYVNGVLTSKKEFGNYVVNNNWNLALGKSINYGGQVIAEMDEFRIWTGAKSAQEIKDAMHLSLDGTQSKLRYNLTFNQQDNGFLQNTVGTPDSIAFTNASLIAATAPVCTIDINYQNKVRGSWSVTANPENGLYVDNNITSFTSNLVAGKNPNKAISTLAASQDTFYLHGAWLLNQMNLDTANLNIALDEVFNDADSLDKFVTEYYLLSGDPQSSYQLVATGTSTNKIVHFTQVPVNFGTYYLAWKADLDQALSQLGGALSLNPGHHVVISKDVVNPIMTNPNGFTLETWARLKSPAGGNTKLIGFSNHTGGQNFGFEFEFLNNQTLQTITGNNGWNANNSTHVWKTNEWNHAAVTFFPNGFFKFYINGEIVDSLQITNFNANANDLAFGKNIWNNAPVDADFDEFRLYERVKTATEIRNDMYKILSGASDTTLRVNYSFNEGNNGYVFNTGTLMDSTIYNDAILVIATNPVRNALAPFHSLMGGSWSAKADDNNGLYLATKPSNTYAHFVAGREADNSILPLGGSSDTSYVNGAWLVSPRSLHQAQDVQVNLDKVLYTKKDSIAENVNSWFLIKGDINGSYSFVAEGTAIGKVVTFANVTLDSALYRLAWRTDTGAVPVTDVFPILTFSDDAEQNTANGTIDLTSSDLEFTKDGSKEQVIGLRFNNITIPQGAVIQQAYIQFTVDEVTTGGNVDLMIGVEDVEQTLPLSSFAYDISNRLRHFGDTTIWNIPDFTTVGDANAAQRTPDVADLLAHVINKPNWVSGNAAVFLMADPFTLGIPGYVGNTGVRTAQSFDNSPANAPKLVVKYIMPERYYNGTFPIAKGSSWKYDTTATDLSALAWTSLTYNDSSWAYGDATLGYGNNNESTVLSYGSDAANKTPTHYLRHIFEVDDASKYDSLVFKVRRDDGVVVYVNGNEAFRQNMPAGTVGFTTYASTAVAGADETTYFETVTAKMLHTGTNVIAVELHQAAGNSSDLSFDMEVGFTEPPLAPATYPLAQGSVWHYLDNGSKLDTLPIWKDTLYSDYQWAIGQAPLGYGDPVTTTLSYGSDANNKHITTYLRRDIMIDTNQLGDTVVVGLRRDDGAVVYLNGTELLRSNMPSGTITYQTGASSAISGSDEINFFEYKVARSNFRQGRNQIAVELHQANNTSSDLVFDMYMEDAPVINPPALGCANGNTEHIACFQSIAPTAQTNNLIIAGGTHRFQMIFKQGEAYTKGGGNVPGNHDFTGYLPLNGSSALGHLAVNHENTPGGVSMLDISYNDSNRLWTVDTSQAVDFYNNDLVTTSRNCSGGITPWGTIITAEEDINSGDLNGDNYLDLGWLIEIDPLTSKVVDYTGDGVQDKLWAMGRMNHENIVVAHDSITAYYGEDGGTHCVYKFVANTPGDLSTGVVYVLKLDQALVNGNPTGTTASWIAVPNGTPAECNNLSSMAAALGGTNFNGVEDVEISPIDGKIYFAAKGQNRVYRFTDNGTSINNFETFVGGASYILNTDQGVFTEPWGNGNDNLAFDDQGNLWVLQDGGNNYIWVVRPDHSQSAPKVELFASMPRGAEPTGLTFSPDYRFGFFSVQHPSGSNTPQLDATGNNVTFNGSATIVFSRDKWLGLQAPIAGFEADTTVVVRGNSVTYNDTSLNSPSTFNWVFNGGAPVVSTNQTETVTYNALGFYTTQLIVSNASGSDTAVYTQYIEVIEPAPVANFIGNITTLTAGNSVSFTDLSSNTPDSLYWTFSGGTPANSSALNPVITYNTTGVYDVTLVAFNRAGASAPLTKSMYITVTQPAPVADFVASATQITVGDSVSFTDLSTNDPTILSWIFNGGTPSVSADTMPTIKYLNPGFYDVTLVATNSTGNSAPTTKIAYIEVIDDVSIDEQILLGKVNIYPNPSSGEVNVDLTLNGGELITIELFDLSAHKLGVLANEIANGGKQSWKFDLHSATYGNQAFILRISVNDVSTRHIIQLIK